jgi:hypothetical protein
MRDDFITSLQMDWRAAPAGMPAEALIAVRNARRGRMLAAVLLAAELGMLALAFAAGVWFALVALETKRLIFTLASVVLVGMTPAFALATVLARRGGLKWEEETPAGVLRARRRQVEATLRALWLGWWAIGVMAAFILVLWMLELGGLLGERDFLILYTAIAAAVCVTGGAWILFRQPRLAEEREACERMLAELAEG